MTDQTYFSPKGGLPPQSQLMTGRAIFTDAYAVTPKGVMSDIVTSYLPHWNNARAWIIARPLSGLPRHFRNILSRLHQKVVQIALSRTQVPSGFVCGQR